MIGVIADDLTGAAELAAVGWRHGMRAEVVLGGEEVGGCGQLGKLPARSQAASVRHYPDLICVDTDSRLCLAEEAGRRVATVTRALCAAGAQWTYKKVDSVLRGNVTVELKAMMRETGTPAALLVPANPSLGRVIRNGHYFVHGRPLHETEFAHDPVHPRLSSSVVALLESGETVHIQSRRADAGLLASGIIVGEAGRQVDLDAWATQRRPGVSLAGGAEFFRALLGAHGFLARPNPAPDVSTRAAERALFVCGSTSNACRQFVERARVSGVPVFGLPEKLARGGACDATELQAIVQKAVSALAGSRRVMLAVGLPVVLEGGPAQRLAVHLVTVAAAVLRRAAVDHVFAEGGATAAGLARSMGWTRLRVVRELSLGVATMVVDSSPPLLFTMKPGSYAWPDAVLPAR